jgi:hypothetical protein
MTNTEEKELFIREWNNMFYDEERNDEGIKTGILRWKNPSAKELESFFISFINFTCLHREEK